MVGQEHVVRTLSNAIEQDRVHHAYLFVGSRGTGKTSMAKILAASLNCQNGGPTVSPCGRCESCVSIQNATSLDVVEMDAASNNSVDDVRDLRERVAFAPVGGGFKVYILDEAHMLTPQAWNAFLKTLEEPPPHTIFVLATTEANKVLPTVVDRCHRFDFSRPSVPQIANVLRRVSDTESISIPDEAIALVARSATGSFRDALGTLEQLLAYSGSSIALDDVLAVLGAADADLIFGAVDAVSVGDARAALLAAARLAESGRDLGRFFGDLEAHARALMVVQVLGDVPPELRVTAEQDERLAQQAERVGQAEVVRLLELIASALRALKDGADARTQLELALVKAATPELEPSVKALQARIARLESRPAAPAPRTPDQPQTAAGRATTTSQAAASTGNAAPSQAAPLAQAAPSSQPAPVQPAPPVQATPTSQPAPTQAAPTSQPAPTQAAPTSQAAPVQPAPPAQAAPPSHAAPAQPTSAGHAAPSQSVAPAQAEPPSQAVPSQPAPTGPTAPPTHDATTGPAAPAGIPPADDVPAGAAPPAPVEPEEDRSAEPPPYGVPHPSVAPPAYGQPRISPYGQPREAVPAPAGDAHEDEAVRGRTAVAITAQVDGQPPVEVRTTLPGAGNMAPEEAQHVADEAAAAVARDLATEADPHPAVAAVAVVEPDVPAPAPSLGVSVEIGEHWKAVVESLREGTPLLAAALDDAVPVPGDDDGLRLVWPEESAFMKRKAEAPANQSALVEAIRAVTGTSLRLAYELRAAGSPPPALPSAGGAVAPAALSDEDLVQRFMEEFDAELLPDEPEEQT